MLRKRIIPCLLLQEDFLVKTVRFKNPKYIGDPINAITIFNDKEVDEIIILDILSSKNEQKINFPMIEKIVKECFVPLTYGGGVKSAKEMKQIYELGVEKIVINTNFLNNRGLLEESVDIFGSQSIVAGVDVVKSFIGDYKIYSHSQNKKTNLHFLNYLSELEQKGVGEIFLNYVDNEGTWSGYDIKLNQIVSKKLKIPIIASGGAGSFSHIAELFKKTEVMAAAIGSMAVYQKKDYGVLINFPLKKEREEILNARVY